MGNSSSSLTRRISPFQAELNLSYHQISELPYSLPRKNRLVILDLSGNSINCLPTKLKRLVKLILAKNGIIEIPEQFEQAFQNMKKLQHLDLSFNQLTILPNYFTSLTSLRRLELCSNRLSELPNFSPGIEIIDISQNRFTKLPKLSSSVLIVIANFNYIKELDSFVNNVKLLSLSMNKITTIKSCLLFQYLQTIDLSMNRLESLPDFKFVAPKLTKADFSLNLLTEMPKFSKTLKDLNISGNKIEEIPDILDLYPNLISLRASSNQIRKVGKLPKSLQSLYLQDNLLEETEPCKLEVLETVFLYNNQLKILPNWGKTLIKDGFLSCNKLESLDLDNTMFDRALITKINVSGNLLTHIHPDVFDLPNLIYLNLSNNQISKIPKIISLSKLLFFNISENPIKKIKFDLPLTLLSFYCSKCELTELPNSLEDCSNLSILICSNNKISKIPYIPNLGCLNASQNAIQEFPKIQKFIKHIDLSMNNIQKLPETFDFSNLTDFDVSYNQIKKLPNIPKFVLNKIKVFKVAHNIDLKGEIEPTDFTLGETLDISFTKLKVVGKQMDTIREIIVSNREQYYPEPSLYHQFQMKLFTEPDFVGYSEVCGIRDEMEDAIIARPGIVAGNDIYAVLDGHGGSNTANYGVGKIAEIFNIDSNQELSSKQIMTKEFVKQKIAELLECIRSKRFNDGATMALALLSKKKVIMANLGDARVLLIKKDGKVKAATVDHKPSNRDEIDRILDLGGKIINERTDGILAISRSLGDFSIYGLSYEPGLYEAKIGKDDRWIVIACDGIFDVISNEDVGLLSTTASTASELAYLLRNIALVRLSSDNISTMVIDLYQRKNSSSS